MVIVCVVVVIYSGDVLCADDVVDGDGTAASLVIYVVRTADEKGAVHLPSSHVLLI